MFLYYCCGTPDFRLLVVYKQIKRVLKKQTKMPTVIKQMLDLAKSNGVSGQIAYMTHTLFQQLREVDKYWEVEWACDSNIFHCRGKRSKDGQSSVFIPISSNETTSIEFIEKCQSVFKTDRIVLAMHSPDSSHVYYEISKGLVKQNSEKGNKELSDTYIRNNRKRIISQAQGNVPWP